jgi:hypothetical protein
MTARKASIVSGCFMGQTPYRGQFDDIMRGEADGMLKAMV